MIREIFIVEDKPELINILNDSIVEKDADVKLKQVRSCDFEKQLVDIPALILINEDGLLDLDVFEVGHLIQNSEDNAATPVIAVCSDLSFEHENRILNSGIHSCIPRPFNGNNVYTMLKHISNLMLINRGISPLTKLPRQYSYSV